MKISGWNSIVCGLYLLIAACEALPCADISESRQVHRAKEVQQDINDRILEGMRAGIAEARRRGATDLPPEDELPLVAKQTDGEFHPLVKRFALDGDGRLRGEGKDMSALEFEAKVAADEVKKLRDTHPIERCWARGDE